MVWEEIEAEENLDGLSEAQRATFRERAVPEPAALLKEGHEFTNDARLDIPSHAHRDRVHRRGLPDVREGAPRVGVPRRAPGAAQRHLHRPADQPLADVVEADRARGDHRRCRHEGRRTGRDAHDATLLDDAFAHHVWATERMIDPCAGLTPRAARGRRARHVRAPSSARSATWWHDAWYLSFFRDRARPIDEDARDVARELRSAIMTQRRGLDRAVAAASTRRRTWSSRAKAGTSMRRWASPRPGRPPRHRSPEPDLHGADEPRRRAPEIDLWAYGEATGRTRAVARAAT